MQRKRRKLLLYFTFSENMSGVLQSQVIEVIKALRNENSQVEVRLFSILSLRNFKAEKKKVKRLEPTAIVLPSLGPLRFWYLNKYYKYIKIGLGRSKIVFSRGPIATCIALDCFKNSKIIYDGRGAIVAEQEEYKVYNGSGLENNLENIERRAVLESDGRIAVSKKLVSYWREKYNYRGDKHEIIPCTVSELTNNNNISGQLEEFLANNSYNTIFTFAGGNAKWQGIEKLVNFLETQFTKFPDTCAILLTTENGLLEDLREKFPKRIIITAVLPDQVLPVLSKCDYGILLREKNTTNRVASPVKVAEYLQAGLKVLISPEIGDYSDIIIQNDLGCVIDSQQDYEQRFEKPSQATKRENIDFCNAYYSKDSKIIMQKYKSLLQ